MSNRRKLRESKPTVQAEPDVLKVGLIVDPEEPVDTTVQMLFRRPTIGTLGQAAEHGEMGSELFTAALAHLTYLRTETMAGEDLILSWDELAQGVLGDADLIGRIRGQEAPSNYWRTLASVAAFNGFPWTGGGAGGA